MPNLEFIIRIGHHHYLEKNSVIYRHKTIITWEQCGVDGEIYCYFYVFKEI